MHHQAYQHQQIYQLRRKEEIPRHLTKETENLADQKQVKKNQQ